jgi:putative membrane protein
MTLEYHAQATLEATTPLWNLAGWLVATPFTVLTTLVAPCVMLGVGVERWGALQDPSGHRGALVAIAGGGLLAGALGALPYALGQLDWAHVGGSGWTFPLFHASGVAGACGWLALLALLGGGPREASAEFAQGAASFEELGAFRSFLSAIGRRSMTAYLAQTLVFAVLFLVLGAVGVRSVGVAVSALIALAVWALIGVGCVISDAMGRTRGPAERLLRWLVARTAWTLPLPKLPMSIYGAPTPGAVQNLGVKGAPKAMMSVSRDAEGVLPDSLDGMQNDANS